MDRQARADMARTKLQELLADVTAGRGVLHVEYTENVSPPRKDITGTMTPDQRIRTLTVTVEE